VVAATDAEQRIHRREVDAQQIENAKASAERRVQELELALRHAGEMSAVTAPSTAADADIEELTLSEVSELEPTANASIYASETTLELTARDLEEASEFSEPSIEVERIEAESPEADAIYAEALAAERPEALPSAAAEPSARSQSSVRELKPKPRAARASRRDDLTQIRGIGERYAERLAELGVSTFARIAGWSAPDVQRAGEQLGIGAKRIQREGWVKQARKLHARAEAARTPRPTPARGRKRA